MATFGVTPLGFVPKQQSQIITEIQQELQSALGVSINLAPESVFGQLIGIFSEREALIWQLNEAVYDSQYPSGAEGTSVDNILALNGLQREGASPSTVQVYAFGTPGTVITVGSIVTLFGDPNTQFTTDEAKTIQASIDAIQTIFFTSTPTVGSFILRIAKQVTIVTVDTVQNNTQYFVTINGQTLSITSSASATVNSILNQLLNAIQNANPDLLVNATLDGTDLILTPFEAGNPGTSTPMIFTFDCSSNLDEVTVTTQDTAPIAYNAADTAVQAAINALTTFEDVTVSGSFAAGFVVEFAGTAGSQIQPTMTFLSNTLMNLSVGVNISIVNSQDGAPAQAIIDCTCTVDGPTGVVAKTVNVIGSPISGWDSVVNFDDGIVGTNVETDTEAMERFLGLRASLANGPLQSIIQKVSLVDDVTRVIGAENTGMTEDSDGRPAKSFEITAIGGEPVDIATAIFGAKPAGIESYGNIYLAGDVTNLSDTITDLSSTTDLQVGARITGTGIPDDTFIETILSGTSVRMTENATSTLAGGTIAFQNSYDISDQYGNVYPIEFSRPIEVRIYVAIELTGNIDEFPTDGISQIQADIVAIGNAFDVGSLVIGFGSKGLVGAFNNVDGITGYTLAFSRSNPPSGNANIQMAANEKPVFETFNVIVDTTDIT